MWYPVERLNGWFGYYRSAHEWVSVVHSQDIIAGWNPIGLFRISSNIFILEFHSYGLEASWYLDAEHTRLGGAVNELTPACKSSLTTSILDITAKVLSDVFFSSGLDENDPTGFLNINSATRMDLYSLVHDYSLPLEVKDIEDLVDLPDLRFIKELLAIDIRSAIINSGGNHLSIPCPETGNLTETDCTLIFDDFRSAIRLISSNSNIYYLGCTDHYFRVTGLYRTDQNTIYVNGSHNLNITNGCFSGMRHDFLRMVMRYGKDLSKYMIAKDRKLAGLLRPPPSHHIGHQLWNELSGIQGLIEALPAAQLPVVYVPDAHRGTEIYGPIEMLFPELDGKVIRTKGEDWILSAYKQRIAALRYPGIFVSKELRARIVAYSLSNVGPEDWGLAKTFKHERRLILIIGLRVENRTVVDLDTFLEDMITLVSEYYPGSLLVLDGHNCRETNVGSEAFGTFGQSNEARSPIEVELEIASKLTFFAKDRNISVLSLIGSAVSRSLFWSEMADVCLAVWGAGLAKYRWVANTPTLVITSAWNLENRKDLHIYSAPAFMSDPSPLAFISKDLVFDRPDAPQLIFVPHTDQDRMGYVNFSVETKGVFTALQQLIDDANLFMDKSND